MCFSFMFPFFPVFVFLAMMVVRVAVVIFPDHVSVMIVKNKDNRCRNVYNHSWFDYDRSSVIAIFAIIAIMHDATGSKDSHQKQDCYK